MHSFFIVSHFSWLTLLVVRIFLTMKLTLDNIRARFDRSLGGSIKRSLLQLKGETAAAKNTMYCATFI